MSKYLNIGTDAKQLFKKDHIGDPLYNLVVGSYFVETDGDNIIGAHHLAATSYEAATTEATEVGQFIWCHCNCH